MNIIIRWWNNKCNLWRVWVEKKSEVATHQKIRNDNVFVLWYLSIVEIPNNESGCAHESSPSPKFIETSITLMILTNSLSLV